MSELDAIAKRFWLALGITLLLVLLSKIIPDAWTKFPDLFHAPSPAEKAEKE